MPSFFPYAQDDLMAFCLRVADSVETPVLLYNLPQFTTGLEPETTLALLRACPNIVGIKDSSGSLDTVELLKRELPEACRIIGNDGALAQALRRGLADAVVSGVACVLPELMTALFASGYNGEPDPLLEEALNAFIAQLDTMPTPWALKVMAEARGLTPAWFALPLSARRQGQREALSQWLQQNLDAMWATRLAPQEA
jgi:4-hydroxy-tetrahydrodipicolinate synthase